MTGIRTTPGRPLRGSVNLCSSAANCLLLCVSAFPVLAAALFLSQAAVFLVSVETALPHLCRF